MIRIAFLMVFALSLTACGNNNDSDSWLLGADTDEERFERLESYLGGFSAAMWEVGYRYEQAHTALSRENYELARYHWDKIGGAIEGGYMKRPGRQANADLLFMNGVWGSVLEDIESADAQRAWEGFEQGRAACMACHAAEGVAFMNDQPVFDLRSPNRD